MIGIYKITNTKNGKIYIGQSKDINRRWIEHKCYYKSKNHHSSSSYLYSSMRKYGIEFFSFEVIEEVEENELDAKEIFYINLYCSNKKENGYNLTNGGDKGQTLIGANNPNSHLSNEIVFEIRELYLKGFLKRQAYKLINEKIKINHNTFGCIWNGRGYKDIHYDVYDDCNKDKIREIRKINRSIVSETSSKKYVLEIRDARKNGEYWEDVYERYKNYMSKYVFMDIWANNTYKYIQSSILPKTNNKHCKKLKYRNIGINQIDIKNKCILRTFKDVYEICDKVFKNKPHKNTIHRIISVCNNKEKTAYGYIWSFKDSND